MSAALTSTRLSVTAARPSRRAGFRVLLQLWLRRMRDRRELAQLTAYELRDFGASRSDALAEIRKPFWQA